MYPNESIDIGSDGSPFTAITCTNLTVVVVADLNDDSTENRSTVSTSSWWSSTAADLTGQVATAGLGADVLVVGLPGPLFAVVHVAALTSLTLTIVVGVILLVYHCACRRRRSTNTLKRRPAIKVKNVVSSRTNGTDEISSSDFSSNAVVNASTQVVHAAGAAAAGVAVAVAAAVVASAGSTRKIRRLSYSASRTDVAAYVAALRDRYETGSAVAAAAAAAASSAAAGAESKTLAPLSFWRWNVGHRIIVYVVVCDVCRCLVQTMDHAVRLAVRADTPQRACIAFAFVLQEFTYGQWFVAFFAAINAVGFVFCGKKLTLGRCDWKLLVGAFGSPLVIGFLTLGFGVLGSNGAW